MRSRATQIIRATDGTIRKLSSLDGERYVLDVKKEERRIKDAIKANSRNETIINKSFAALVKPPDATTDTIGKTFTVAYPGEQRARDHAKRGRKLKGEKELFVNKNAVHFHRCHGKEFICKCNEPYFKRKCGGSVCLDGLPIQQLIKAAKG